MNWYCDCPFSGIKLMKLQIFHVSVPQFLPHQKLRKQKLKVH